MEHLLGGNDGLVGPVVPHPVAVAETPGDALLRFAALVVALPVAGTVEHDRFDDGDQLRPLARVDEFVLDGREREQRLPKGKGEAGPDLQDRPVVFDQPGQVRRGLVVGRVRLEHQLGLGVDHVTQLRCEFAPVVDNLQVVELDGRLHDNGDDSRPHR